MADQAYIELRKKLAVACRILGEEGQGAITLGHVSLRVPGKDKVLMKPFGLGFEEVRPSDLVVLDLEGNKLDGPHPPHGERFIHTEILKARQEVQSVIHTHPFFATVLGTTGEELLPLTHEGVLFIQGVPLYDVTPELITTKEGSIPIAQKLGDKRALFIKNHGVVVVGRSLQEAVISALYLETAAKAQVTAKVFGRLNPIEKQTALRMHDRQYQVERFDQFWDYYARKFQKP